MLAAKSNKFFFFHESVTKLVLPLVETFLFGIFEIAQNLENPNTQTVSVITGTEMKLLLFRNLLSSENFFEISGPARCGQLKNAKECVALLIRFCFFVL